MISGFIGLFLAHYIIRFRSARGGMALLALVLAATLWSVAYALEIASPDLVDKLFWAKIEYLGIIVIPPAWLIFSAQRRGSGSWLERSPRNQFLLWIVPVLTLCLVWTNEQHHLVWQQVDLLTSGILQILNIVHGPWFWVLLAFSYCLLLVGSIWLATTLFRPAAIDRRMIGFALIGIFIPWIGNLIYVTNLNPLPFLDWTPFAFILAGLMFSLSLFRYHLLNISPIAHKTVFDGLADIILVLDMQNRIVDMNPAGQQMVGKPLRMIAGEPIAQHLPEISASLGNGSDHIDGFQVEMPYGEEPDLRIYQLQVSPLFNQHRTPIGRLVTLHNITQHKLDQAQLESARDKLEKHVFEQTATLERTNEQLQMELAQRVLAEQEQNRLLEEIRQSQEHLRALTFHLQEVQENERSQIASVLHDRVGQNLTGLNLNLKMVQGLLSLESEMAGRNRLNDALQMVEEITRQVRDVMSDLHPPILEEYGLVSAVQWYSGIFSHRTGIVTEVVGNEFEPRLSPGVETVLFRIAQEALNNVAKHAQATRVMICVGSLDRDACLRVEDDGVGFDPQDLDSPNGQPRWGLFSMQQRVTSIGGELTIDSAPGQGTQFSVSFRRPQNDD